MTSTEHWSTIALIAIGIAFTIPIGHLVRHTIADNCGHRTPINSVLAATGAAAIASMLLPASPAAAAFAAPWWLVAVAFAASACLGVRHQVRSLVRRPAALIDALLPLGALIWWANAAGWLVAHRAGLEPFGFVRPIALLTVGHFLHAGFGLSVLLAAAHGHLGRQAGTRAICVAHQAGMLIVAAGISFSNTLATVGSVVITAALAGWAWVAIGPLRRQAPPLARRLLAVSAVAWILPMGLAIAWAVGPLLGEPLVRTFETMLRFHGAINAIGLTLAGLIAMAITPTAARTATTATTPAATSADRLRKDRDDHVHTT